jgi:hypothetical protein
MGALFHETLGDGEPDATISAADDGDLTFQSQHDASPATVLKFVLSTGTRTASWRALDGRQIGPAASGLQCGNAHMDGAKMIRASGLGSVAAGGIRLTRKRIFCGKRVMFALSHM